LSQYRTDNTSYTDCTLMFDAIKKAAAGRWAEILAATTPLTGDELTKGRADHPCPLCDSKSTIWPAKDAQQTGSIACRKCTNNKPTGDGIATVAKFAGLSSQGEAARLVAEYLGMSFAQTLGLKNTPIDIIEAVAKDKRIPLDAFLQFAPEPTTRGRNKRPVARVKVYNQHGETHSYFDFAPGEKGWFKRGDGAAGMFFPGRLPQPGETWHLVEGAKDAAVLMDLGFNAAGLPTSFMAAKYARLFDGVHLVCVPDLDLAGQRGALKTCGHAVGIAASVRIVRLPGEVLDKSGDDVRDVLRKHGADAIREAVANAKPWEPRETEHDPKDGRPEVLLSFTEGFVADQVVSHLGKLGWASDWVPKPLRETVKVYTRGGALVHAIESEDPQSKGQLGIKPIPSCIVRERITQAVQLIVERETSDGPEIVPTRPPKWLIDAVHSRGWYAGKVKPLTGVVESPTLRSDGTILQAAGYDEATGLIYRPNADFPKLPDQPSRNDAQRAVMELLEVINDFPFLDDADRSAWLAMVLSMIGRQAVTGCVPLFAVTSNIRGSGKSLLVDAASRIAFGRSAARKAFTRDDDELRKAITAIALEAAHAVLFDNLDVQLGGASLDAALTAESWSDRVLGSSRMAGDLPLRTVWSCTGNNIGFGSDVARRVLPIRLQSPLESPEERSDFVHADLLGFVAENRPRLAIAALSILRAYFVAGRPEQPGGEWGSFEAWSRTIRGAVVWAGAADPLPTRATATANDDAKTLLAMLITGIEEADPDNTGLTTKEIERLTTHRPDDAPTCPTLVAAVGEICGTRFDARKFARRMRSYIGRVYEGRQIATEQAHGGVKRWRVKAVNGGCGGSGGSQQPQS
jgi:putative DNA primase/helicase